MGWLVFIFQRTSVAAVHCKRRRGGGGGRRKGQKKMQRNTYSHACCGVIVKAYFPSLPASLPHSLPPSLSPSGPVRSVRKRAGGCRTQRPGAKRTSTE